ncbi:S10 family peptidase [Psychroflexus sediminis]|uniref:Carboxypeptidase C (Cathepsin A) n=1 Tax=Psychroflexus sediminis TaxID=470826 RepID=A0A1G7Z6S5_9FLAO|nr:carboxypeptidase [Psychroflexus sediminis]SDH04451.1 Carboxypeptidase C (cathepsin A) [Psychroflexus sediminis]
MKNQLLTALFILYTLVSYSQEPTEDKKIPEGEVYTSSQSVSINGKTINLDTETGTIQLRDENDQPIALFGFTHYKKSGETNNRPIVFAFNGGPLSASFWLHFGILGPKRVVINDPDYTKPAPYTIVNNEFSILDKADLVMLDPVGVGFSRPVGEAKWTDFWGVDQDVRSIGLFIDQFLIREGKYNSPKYLLGESYGTFRNAALVKHLQDKGIAMNGVIMVSAVFELQHLLFGPGDDIAYLTHFPTYAATAWYHDKVKNKGNSLESFLEEVRYFTENEYAPALLKGDRLSVSDKASMAQKLSDLTGLSPDYWIKANLRVTNSEFFQELMREEGETVGRLDSRFKGINEDLLSQNAFTDPQSDAISAPYIAAFKDYLYNDLNANKDLTYTTTASGREGFKWDWKHKGNVSWNAQTAISTLPDMTSAMKRNPNLKILILNGYYDLATVFYGVEYSINHMGLEPELRDNIIMKYYEAGHMMYTHLPSMEKFKKDVDQFIDETSKP